MKKLAFFLLVIAAVLFVVWPLARPGFFVSDDGSWMVIRLSAFYQSFREGQFPVRFLGRLNYGYGYPVANFLYPGFMYIGSIIRAAGIPFVETVKIIIAGSVIGSTLFIFLWLKKYFHAAAAAIGAFTFVTAPYLLFDIYSRGSVGEVLAIFAGAVGTYSIASRRAWLFGLSVPFLIVSHNSVALLFTVFFVFYITMLKAWREFLFAFAAGVGMAAFFWLPAIYERKYVIFDAVTVSDPRQYFVGGNNAMLLGPAGIIAALVALAVPKRFRREKIFFAAVIGLVTVLTLPVSGPLWQVRWFARMVQFPYRFLSVSIIAGAWAAAFALQHGKTFFRIALTAVFIGIGAWNVFSTLGSVRYTFLPEGFYATNEATTTVRDEYMPKWVMRKPTARARERILFYSGQGTITPRTVNTQTIDATVVAAEASIIQINAIYYPGWGATLDDEKVRIDYSNNESVMRIPVPAGTHRLVVSFRETISRFLADALSLGSAVTYVGWVVAQTIRRKRK